jgi:hypothetical protein
MPKLLPPCGIIPYKGDNSKISSQDIGVFAYSIIKFRNKSKYSVTHMLDPTLVKLNMHMTYYISCHDD